MQFVVIISQQVLVMFLLMGVGFAARKKNVLTEEAASSFCGFLLNAAIPCMMVAALYRPFQREQLSGLALAFGFGVALHLIGITLSRLLIRRRGGEEWRVERFGAVYSNCIFMAFPLIRATVGEDGVFYATMFVVTYIISQWTHGIIELGGRISAKKLLLNPGVLSAALGMTIYFLRISLPVPIIDAVSLLGGLNGPLSMVITGAFLAQVRLPVLQSPRLIWAAALRAVVIPLVSLLFIWTTGAFGWFAAAPEVCLAVVLCFACPSAIATILMSAYLNRDKFYATGLVTVSTLMSLVTLPLIAALAAMVLLP